MRDGGASNGLRGRFSFVQCSGRTPGRESSSQAHTQIQEANGERCLGLAHAQWGVRETVVKAAV